MILDTIELRERLWGGGYVGHVSASPTLSWADSAALGRSARAAEATAQAVARVGWSVEDVSLALHRLRFEMGYELDQQTSVLRDQLAALTAIHETLRTPAKTRAAERVADAATLLETERYDRALALAKEAIELDPVSPAGFLAAGWALVGDRRFEEARPHFEEAAQASSGDDRSKHRRQAARIAYATGDTAGAAGLIEAARDDTSEDEEIRLDYDGAIYDAALGRHATALNRLKSVCDRDWRYGAEAAVDKALADFPDLQAATVEYAALARRSGEERERELRARVDTARSTIPDRMRWLAADDSYSISRNRIIELVESLDDGLGRLNRVDATARGEQLDELDRSLTSVVDEVEALQEASDSARNRNRAAMNAEEARVLGPVPTDQRRGLRRLLGRY